MQQQLKTISEINCRCCNSSTEKQKNFAVKKDQRNKSTSGFFFKEKKCTFENYVENLFWEDI